MAEYKNGVNYAGNMSVNTDDVSPDVVTGRVVFVDDDKYENDSKYKAKVDKCVEEGFYKVSSEDAGSGSDSSGGGTEPLILTYARSDSTSELNESWQEVYDALAEGREVISTRVDSSQMVIQIHFVTASTFSAENEDVFYISGYYFTYAHYDEDPNMEIKMYASSTNTGHLMSWD